jgi:ATP-binding cassette subfamily B protein
VGVVTVGYSSMIDAISHLLAILVLWRAGEQVLAGKLSIGSALTLQLLAIGGTVPLLMIGPLYGRLLEVSVSWHRLRHPFRVPVLPAPDPTARPCPALDGPVTFEHIDFRYPFTSRPVLQDVSFTLQPGVVTALVGSTGAGKSSVAKVLGRTYDPDSGRVSVAGADLREIDLDSYRARIGIVPQDAFLFRGTVASNVAYGRPDATAEEIAAVVAAVGADEVLAQLPGGLDHIVEEEGRNLTTAQSQLIALARAWLARPELLVLDEATSSLDGALEYSVLEAVSRLGVTTLMITHRQGVAAAAAEIVVLEQGRVAAAGPAAEVVESAPYARLWVAEDELIA